MSNYTQQQEMHSESTNLRQSGGSGFRTLDSRIRSVIRIATKIVSLCPWAMPYPRQNPFASLRVIRRTDRQTDKQTNWQTDRTKNITSFFGGGNEVSWDEVRWGEICHNHTHTHTHARTHARHVCSSQLPQPAWSKGGSQLTIRWTGCPNTVKELFW